MGRLSGRAVGRSRLRLGLISVGSLLLFALPVAAAPAKPMSSQVDASTQDDDGSAWATLESAIADSGALGAYVDANQQVVVVVPSSGSSSFRQDDAAALGFDARIETRDVEPSEVAQIKELVSARASGADLARYATGSGFDPRTGTVTILTNAPRDAFVQIDRAFPNLTSYRYADLNLSRTQDQEAHWGGAKIRSPDDSYPDASCSSGFAVFGVTGAERMLTAGHCFLMGWDVDAWQMPNGTTFGAVTKRDNYPTNDFELVGASGIDHDPKIYVGGTTSTSSRWVLGSVSASGSYDLYCHSGARSGESCGYSYYLSDFELCVTDGFGVDGCRPHTQVFETNAGVFNACAGDSGGPFYRYNGTVYGSDVKILGIVIAGDGDRETCAGGTLTVIEKWSKIQSAYGITLMTH